MNGRFKFWCPNKCGKRVAGKQVCEVGWRNEDRYVCEKCNTHFTIEQLEEYGNNVSRVIRQREREICSPRVEAGMNEW